MDGVHVGAAESSAASRRPPLWELIKATLWGQVLGYLVGFLVLLALDAALVLAVPSVPGDHAYWPWPVDHPWALAANLGWAFFIVSPMAWFVRMSARERSAEPVAFGWAWLAVAVGGYGSLAVFSNDMGVGVGVEQFVGAVVGSTFLLRWLAFRADGSARPWPAWFGRQAFLWCVAAALVLLTANAVLYPLRGDASDNELDVFWQTEGVPGGDIRPGQPVVVRTQLDVGRLPVRILSATPLGPNTATPLRVDAIVGGRALTPVRRAPLPVTVPGSGDVAIYLRMALPHCPRNVRSMEAIDRVRVEYRTLGVDMVKTLRVQWPVDLSCTSR